MIRLVRCGSGAMAIGLLATMLLPAVMRAQEAGSGPRRVADMARLRTPTAPIPAVAVALDGSVLAQRTPTALHMTPTPLPAVPRRLGDGNPALGALFGGAAGLVLGLVVDAVVESAIGSHGDSDTALGLTLYTGGGAAVGGPLFWLFDLP